MPRFVVSLQRHTGRVSCCGAPKAVRTEAVAGTVVTVVHARFCRVGRVLRWPGHDERPGFEHAELTDARQVRGPR